MIEILLPVEWILTYMNMKWQRWTIFCRIKSFYIIISYITRQCFEISLTSTFIYPCTGFSKLNRHYCITLVTTLSSLIYNHFSIIGAAGLIESTNLLTTDYKSEHLKGIEQLGCELCIKVALFSIRHPVSKNLDR